MAALAEDAAEGAGLGEQDRKALRHAGLVHDVGRLGVSNAIWDKPGALTAAELERARLHTVRVLRAVDLAACHAERLDGSGYPGGPASALSPPARSLAACDVYARSWARRAPHDAAGQLRAEVLAGRLDGGADDAALAAAGHSVRRRPTLPAGLTAREVEMLALVSRGASTRQIAERLVRIGSASACGRVRSSVGGARFGLAMWIPPTRTCAGYDRASACHRGVMRRASASWSITSASMHQFSSLV